jgi:hypothetical protein
MIGLGDGRTQADPGADEVSAVPRRGREPEMDEPQRQIVKLHWRGEHLNITYDDGDTARVLAAEAVARDIAEQAGLVVVAGTGNLDLLWEPPC